LLAERDLDLAIVSTTGHWHALPMIEAVKSGADVYVEKPISVDVVEGPGDAGGGAPTRSRRAGRAAAAAAPRTWSRRARRS
jgi:ActR/RegA family two-component response regulator